VCQAVDVLDQNLDDRRRAVVAALQLFYARRDILIRCHQFAHADEGQT